MLSRTFADVAPNSITGVVFRRWRGTAVPDILRRPAFWFSCVVFVGCNLCSELYTETCGQHLPKCDLKELTLLGSVTVFFLAFYTNTCYGRSTFNPDPNPCLTLARVPWEVQEPVRQPEVYREPDADHMHPDAVRNPRAKPA